MKNKTPLLVIVISLVTVVLFQNCSRAQFASVSNKESGLSKTTPEEVVVSNPSQQDTWNKISFQEQKEVFDRTGVVGVYLNLLLDTGELTLGKTVHRRAVGIPGTTRQCKLDDELLGQIKTLLKVSRICKGADNLQPDAVACQAIAISDIQLTSNQNEVVELSKNICANGVFLCDGVDANLRDLLQHVVSNPPANCQHLE